MKNLKLLAGALLATMMSATSFVNAQEWHKAGNNDIGATDFIGTLNPNTQDLRFSLNGTQRMVLKSSNGNLGIGVTSPNSRLHINSTASLSLTASGVFTIGSTTVKNLVFDNDEIQSRNNAAAALLYLNRLGGNVWIGNDATDITSSTPLIHGSNTYGNVGIGAVAVSGNRLFVNGGSENTGVVLRCNVNYLNSAHTTYLETIAIKGISNEEGFGTGVSGEGGWHGVYGYSTGSGNSNRVGVYGTADGSGQGVLKGVYGSASGSNTGLHIGVYGTASGGSENYGGYFDTKVFANAIRIGDVGNEAEAEAAGYKLAVDGKIICEELKVQNSANWPDYVFSDNYKLPSIEEVEQHIKDNKHLPGIPSACELEVNGLLIGDMQKKMMEKIEELTLYVIQLKKENNEMKQLIGLSAK